MSQSSIVAVLRFAALMMVLFAFGAACGDASSGIDASMDLSTVDLSNGTQDDFAGVTPTLSDCHGGDLGTQVTGAGCSFCPPACVGGDCGSCDVDRSYSCEYMSGVFVCSCYSGRWRCGSA
jgi:hypothetical protein